MEKMNMTILRLTLKRYLIALIIFLNATQMFADNNGIIYGFVHNRITHENLFGTKVSLLKNDSVIAEWTTSASSDIYGRKGPWFFYTDLKDGKYSLVFEKEGYNSFTTPLEGKPLKAGEARFVADIPLDRVPKEHVLNGATVRATRVKFFHRGDTIVYNADAFQTAEGSMLDALIKQLPGVELNENGEIKVNGRKVESLLLNGEKFFNGKNEIMLENLPAYMVKNVKTYEKAGIQSQMTGRDMGDKEFVMDVNLKREYSIGWIGNAEAGAGSSDRYLARLFAMRFTPNSRISLYGNMNNLNDTRKPGESSSWTPETMPSGMRATRMAGADLMFKDKEGRKKYNGSVEVKGTAADNYTETTGELFIPSGNVYTRALARSKANNFNVATRHDLEIWSSRQTFALLLSPSLTYNRSDGKADSYDMSFTQNPQIRNASTLIDSINMGNNDLLRSSLINLRRNQQKNHGHSLNLGNTLYILQKIGSVDYLELTSTIKHSSVSDDLFSIKHITYPQSAASSDFFSNRYTNNSPNRNTETTNQLNYRKSLNNELTFLVGYQMEYKNSHKNHRTYLLDQLAGFNKPENTILGILPSEAEYLTTIDSQNSYYQTMRTYNHGLITGFTYDRQSVEQDFDKMHGINRLRIEVGIPLTFSHDNLDYTRSTYSGITRRNNVFLSPQIKGFIQSNAYKDRLDFSYNVNTTAPLMSCQIDLLNNEDPLNLHYGNAHLRNTTQHSARVAWQRSDSKKDFVHQLEMNYNIYHNSVAMGYIYDRQTGIRTYRPENVNGNYKLALLHNISVPLDKRKRLMFGNLVDLSMNHGIDLVGDESDLAPLRSSIMTYWTTDKMVLEYRPTKNIKLGAKGYFGYGKSASSRKDFSTVNVFDFHYGLNALLTLPYKIQISTDLTMYSRRGYANAGSNTNDLVWNARLSKTFTKAGITLAVDGFDVLGNISNISQVLNSQGRTETYRNSLPRYVMFHAIYRLNKQPKKK